MNRAGLILILAAAMGCESRPAPVAVDSSGVAPAADYRELGLVLDRCVNSRGHLLPEAVTANKDALEGQLKRLAVTGPKATPKLFPTADDRVAYWYNAAAAWSLKLAMLEGYPEELSSARLHERPFQLDGQWMTFRDIQRELERDEDFRVAIVMPCTCKQDGALPRTVFSGEDVRPRVEQLFNEYLADPERVKIDIEKRQIVFPAEMWRLRSRIIEAYQKRYGGQDMTLTTALLPIAQGKAQRRLQDAIGYRETAAGERSFLALPGKFEFLRR